MSRSLLVSTCVALLLPLGAEPGRVAEPAKQKLQVYIMAGQSNMVGHAQYPTIPALLTAEEPGVKQFAKLIFRDGVIAPEDTKDMIEVRVKRPGCP